MSIFLKKDKLTLTHRYETTEEFINAFDASYRKLQFELDKKMLEFKHDTEDKKFLEVRKLISKWITNGGILPKKF